MSLVWTLHPINIRLSGSLMDPKDFRVTQIRRGARAGAPATLGQMPNLTM